MLILLHQLQKLEVKEAAIIAAQKNCAEYRQVKELKAEFEQQKKELLRLQDQLGAAQQQIQSLPALLAEIELKLKSERAAVYDGSIANIRELNARQAQISALEEKSAALAAEQKQRQEEFAQGLRQAKQLQQQLEELYQQLNQQYRQYDELRQGWQRELSALAADKKTLLTQIDNEHLTWYEKQKPLFAGIPVAKLYSNHTCDGCQTMVTPIVYKRTVHGESTRCEKCGRYLFVEEETVVSEQ